MNVKEMVEQYLKENDYDGLFADHDCACVIDDLMPCGDYVISCRPGYQTKCDCGEHDYHIDINKRKRLRKRL